MQENVGVNCLGNYYGLGQSFDGAVFGSDGVAPALLASNAHGNAPKIVEIIKLFIKEVDKVNEQNTISRAEHNNRVIEAELIAYDDYNSTIPEDQSVSPTLTTNCGASALRNGVKMIKVRQATKEGFALCELGGVVDLDYPSSETRRGRVIENGQISPTLTTENIPSVIELGNPDFYNFLYEIDGEIYLIRIRKLMPLEYWRLMGFTDEDFYKAEQVVSNTQLYKQAGNSIVVNCLEGIFRGLIE